MKPLKDLIKQFEEEGIPEGPIRIDVASVITDPKKMVESHIRILLNNPGKRIFLQYYKRLALVSDTLKKI